MILTKNKVFGVIFFGAVLLIAIYLGNDYATQHATMWIPPQPQQIQASVEHAQPGQEHFRATRSISNTGKRISKR